MDVTAFIAAISGVASLTVVALGRVGWIAFKEN